MSALKLIYTAIGNGTNRVAKVKLDKEYDEFQVFLYVAGKLQPDATYYTGDLRDATDTADCMADELLFAELQSIKQSRNLKETI